MTIDCADLRRRAELVKDAGIGHSAGPDEVLALLDLAKRLASDLDRLTIHCPEAGWDRWAASVAAGALAAAKEAKL